MSRLLAPALTAVTVMACLPSSAAAHGPLNPAASSFLAHVTQVPPGLDVKAIDGDQRLWLQAGPGLTVAVLDYRGAPYLRFSPAGVQANQNSSMYYLNQTPAEIPPPGLGPSTSPRWVTVSGGHSYEWHDGRLHALATTAIPPGKRYLGRWRIAVTVDGHPAVIAGALYYSPDVPLVWFWPIIVVLACVFAALRLRRPSLDWAIARSLSIVAVLGFTVSVVGQGLHGRPQVTVLQLVVLVAELAFAGWALWRILLGRHGWFTCFLVGAAAIYEGATLITVLVRGFVLLALPALLARIAVLTCLAAGVGLVPLVFRIAPTPEDGADAEESASDDLDLRDEELLA